MRITLLVKRSLCLFLIVWVANSASAQEQPLREYYPVGTEWEEVYTLMVDRYPDEYKTNDFVRTYYRIDKDTVFDNKRYKIVKFKPLEFYNITSESWRTQPGCYFVREQGDSVFFRLDIYSQDRLIYNFDWQENDSIILFNMNNKDRDELEHSQESLSDGFAYDCYSYKNEYAYPKWEKKIYKSIGQTLGGLIRGVSDDSRSRFRPHLTKFIRNNVLIYEKEFASPDGIRQMASDKQPSKKGCFTLQGVKMDERCLAPGIYINNGSKYIKRP